MQRFLQALQREPICVGKPYSHGFEIISEEHGITDKSKVLMIGDNLETDIDFGAVNGFDTVVVLTGVTTQE